MKKSNSLRKSHESGVALISVLCMIFTGSLLVMMTLMISQTGTFSLIPHIEMQHSMYIAEGVSNRVQWLISADRAKNISESQNMFNISRESETEERFLPDGMSHSIDFHGELVSVTIYDTISGIDLSANSYRSSLQNYVSESSDDEELSDNISVLSAKIADYIDSDDVVSTDGME